MTLEEEVAELRAVVAAQSRLLTVLVKYHAAFDPCEKPVVLTDDEVDDLMEEVCENLRPDLVMEYFPLAPQHLVQKPAVD